MECIGVCVGVGVVALSFMGWLVRWLNERRFVRAAGPGPAGSMLPPGSMGWPLIGEMIDFLLCFKFVRRPDDFIAKRKVRYGDTGIYKTHLLGSPTIVTCTPELNKQILGSKTEDGTFGTGWPATELLGNSSLVIVDGLRHKKIRRHMMEAFNSPRTLDSHVTSSQTIIISALDEWATKRRIVAYDETKAVSFSVVFECCRWELLNPDAGVAFQPNPKPIDGAEMIFERAEA